MRWLFELALTFHFPACSMTSKSSTLSRRSLFSGAATVGAVAAATAVLPGVVQQAAPLATALPKPSRGGGYTLSEHVQQYYKTTRV
jgi:hypothetical protein